MPPAEKAPKNIPQPAPLPKLSGKKALGQIVLLLIGPAVLMLVLSLIWK
jgi:hypothetical protein